MENLDENIYQKIQEIFGKMPAKFSVLEEEIDINLQMEYFEFSKLHKNDLSKEEILKRKDRVFQSNISVFEKKLLLSLLAGVEEVIAYRTIEKYLENPDKELASWAVLAFQESRMSIESHLLEENQVFISTGLGGKGSNLRYFIVIIYNQDNKTGPFQTRIVENEFVYIFKKYDAEVEEISHNTTFSTLKALIPLNVPVNDIIKKSIEECNQFGNFINEKYIITNVKTLTNREIKKFIEKEIMK